MHSGFTASITGETVLMSGWMRKAVEVFDAKTDDLLYTIPDFKTPLAWCICLPLAQAD
jgi:hypothetical protein